MIIHELIRPNYAQVSTYERKVIYQWNTPEYGTEVNLNTMRIFVTQDLRNEYQGEALTCNLSIVYEHNISHICHQSINGAPQNMDQK